MIIRGLETQLRKNRITRFLSKVFFIIHPYISVFRCFTIVFTSINKPGILSIKNYMPLTKSFLAGIFITVMSIADNYLKIQEKTSAAALKCGRDPSSVKIMAVSKTQSYDAVLEAYNAGIRLFGENRVAEGVEKFSGLDKKDCIVHLIGHLQRNKAGKALFFDCIQSIDRIETAAALLKYSEKLVEVYLEVNTSGEQSKSGVYGYEALSFLAAGLLRLEKIHIGGLMTIAPFVSDEKPIRKSFSSLYEMSEKFKSDFPEIGSLELSMGMSDDFEYAIMEGSTMIRVGTSIFGRRNYT